LKIFSKNFSRGKEKALPKVLALMRALIEDFSIIPILLIRIHQSQRIMILPKGTLVGLGVFGQGPEILLSIINYK